MPGPTSGRTGVLADPTFRRDRARKAGLARTSLDYHIAKLVDATATLTHDQRAQLCAIAHGGDAR